jgi:hypothetical protein
MGQTIPSAQRAHTAAGCGTRFDAAMFRATMFQDTMFRATISRPGVWLSY